MPWSWKAPVPDGRASVWVSGNQQAFVCVVRLAPELVAGRCALYDSGHVPGTQRPPTTAPTGHE